MSAPPHHQACDACSSAAAMEHWVRDKLDQCKEDMLLEWDRYATLAGNIGCEKAYIRCCAAECKARWDSLVEELPEKKDVIATAIPEERYENLQKLCAKLRERVRSQNQMAYEVLEVLKGKYQRQETTLDYIHNTLQKEVVLLREQLFRTRHGHAASDFNPDDFSLIDFVRFAENNMMETAKAMTDFLQDKRAFEADVTLTIDEGNPRAREGEWRDRLDKEREAHGKELKHTMVLLEASKTKLHMKTSELATLRAIHDADIKRLTGQAEELGAANADLEAKLKTIAEQLPPPASPDGALTAAARGAHHTPSPAPYYPRPRTAPTATLPDGQGDASSDTPGTAQGGDRARDAILNDMKLQNLAMSTETRFKRYEDARAREVGDLLQKNSDLYQKCCSLQDEVGKAKAELSTAVLEAEVRTRQGCAKMFTAEKARYEETLRDREATESRFETLLRQAESNKSECATLRREKAALEKKLQERLTEISVFQNEISSLQAQPDPAPIRSPSLVEANNVLSEEQGVLQQQLEDARTAAAQQEALIASLKEGHARDVGVLQQELADLASAEKEATQQSSRLAAEKAAESAKLSQALTRIDQAAAQHREAEAQHAERMAEQEGLLATARGKFESLVEATQSRSVTRSVSRLIGGGSPKALAQAHPTPAPAAVDADAEADDSDGCADDIISREVCLLRENAEEAELRAAEAEAQLILLRAAAPPPPSPPRRRTSQEAAAAAAAPSMPACPAAAVSAPAPAMVVREVAVQCEGGVVVDAAVQAEDGAAAALQSRCTEAEHQADHLRNLAHRHESLLEVKAAELEEAGTANNAAWCTLLDTFSLYESAARSELHRCEEVGAGVVTAVHRYLLQACCGVVTSTKARRIPVRRQNSSAGSSSHGDSGDAAEERAVAVPGETHQQQDATEDLLKAATQRWQNQVSEGRVNSAGETGFYEVMDRGTQIIVRALSREVRDSSVVSLSGGGAFGTFGVGGGFSFADGETTDPSSRRSTRMQSAVSLAGPPPHGARSILRQSRSASAAGAPPARGSARPSGPPVTASLKDVLRQSLGGAFAGGQSDGSVIVTSVYTPSREAKHEGGAAGGALPVIAPEVAAAIQAGGTSQQVSLQGVVQAPRPPARLPGNTPQAVMKHAARKKERFNPRKASQGEWEEVVVEAPVPQGR